MTISEAIEAHHDLLESRRMVFDTERQIGVPMPAEQFDAGVMMAVETAARRSQARRAMKETEA